MITSTYKTCSKCGGKKVIEDFHLNARNKDGRCGRCKDCINEYTKGYFRENKQQVMQQRATRSAENQAYFAKRVIDHKTFMNELKNVPCLDCKERYPAVCMEFDHVLPGKRYNPAAMSNHKRELVERELALCEVVCACCHRVRTANRRPPNKHNTQPAMLRKLLDFRAWMNELKSAPCKDCGRTLPPVAMDFDHVRGEKIKGVSAMWSWRHARVLLEVAKCDLVCACCHRLRTVSREPSANAAETATMAAA